MPVRPGIVVGSPLGVKGKEAELPDHPTASDDRMGQHPKPKVDIPIERTTTKSWEQHLLDLVVQDCVPKPSVAVNRRSKRNQGMHEVPAPLGNLGIVTRNSSPRANSFILRWLSDLPISQYHTPSLVCACTLPPNITANSCGSKMYPAIPVSVLVIEQV